MEETVIGGIIAGALAFAALFGGIFWMWTHPIFPTKRG